MPVAASFQVSGAHGVLNLLALVCFLAAAIVAWVAPGHRAAVALIALGLCLLTLAGMWNA